MCSAEGPDISEYTPTVLRGSHCGYAYEFYLDKHWAGLHPSIDTDVIICGEGLASVECHLELMCYSWQPFVVVTMSSPQWKTVFDTTVCGWHRLTDDATNWFRHAKQVLSNKFQTEPYGAHCGWLGTSLKYNVNRLHPCLHPVYQRSRIGDRCQAEAETLVIFDQALEMMRADGLTIVGKGR